MILDYQLGIQAFYVIAGVASIIEASSPDYCATPTQYQCKQTNCNDREVCLYGQCYRITEIRSTSEGINIFNYQDANCFKMKKVGTNALGFCSKSTTCPQGVCINGYCRSLSCPENVQDWCPGTSICDNGACRPSEVLFPLRSCKNHEQCPRPGKCTTAGYCHQLLYPREFNCTYGPPEIAGLQIQQCKIGMISCGKSYHCVGYQGDNVGQLGICCPNRPAYVNFRAPACPHGRAVPFNGFECTTAHNGKYHNRVDSETKMYACCPKFCSEKDEFFDGRRCRYITETCRSPFDCPGSNIGCFGRNKEYMCTSPANNYESQMLIRKLMNSNQGT